MEYVGSSHRIGGTQRHCYHWGQRYIKNKIPTDASKENQLADKKFVTDSISTNSATFRGTFDSISDLPKSEIDNNDYAFIKTVIDTNNQTYTRYRYNGENWVEEFTLNNTPFNTDQWEAINSGITGDTLSLLTSAFAEANTNINTSKTIQDIQTNLQTLFTEIVNILSK